MKIKVLWREWPALLAAPFFPLFFIPLAGAGLNSLEMNFIAALLLCLATLANLNGVINNRFIIYGITIPWLLMLIGYALSTIFLGLRTSFIPFFSQIVFLIATVGLSATIEKWITKKSNKLAIFIIAIIMGYFAGLYLKAPPENFWGLWSSLIKLDVWQLIVNARRAFNPDAFMGEMMSTDRLANNHNRIAQQTFSLGYFVVVISLFSQNTLSLLSKKIFVGFGCLMIILSLLLMSGQSMGQLLLAIIFCSIASTAFNPTRTKLILALITPLLLALSIILISDTVFGEAWLARLNSGNIDTGRVVRWSWYWENGSAWTVLGERQSLPIDPHNIAVTLLFDIGLLGVLGLIIFMSALALRSFSGIRSGYEHHGLAFLMAIATGPQIVFVMMIAGGYGFPGWAELSKFSLFLLAVSIARSARTSF